MNSALSLRVGSFVVCQWPNLYLPAPIAVGTPQNGLDAVASAKPGTPCRRAKPAVGAV